MKLFKAIWDFFFAGGDEVHETVKCENYHPPKGHVEKVDGNQFVWVEDKKEDGT